MIRCSLAALAALAIQAAAPAPSFAEGGQSPAPLPAVVVDQGPHDWTGLYGGLGLSLNRGDIDFVNPNSPNALDDGSGGTVFGGYMLQRGALVYGGEVAFSDTNDQTVVGFPATVARVEFVADFNARLGYAFDRFLVFGQLGYATSEYTEPFAAGTWNLNGVSYGVGANYAVTDSVSVGLLYTERELNGDNPSGSGQSVDIPLNSLSMRAAFHF